MTEKEKAIEWLKACKDTNYRHSATIQGYMDVAIKALEEPILDKIRAEIEQNIDKEKLSFGGQFDRGLNLAIKIIDKYKTESEEEE